MSTNPFRRSSLKGPGGSNPSNLPPSAASEPTGSPGPLSVNTRVPSVSQKRVNFASPPAIPISPVSYPPSSPESYRQEAFSPFPSPGPTLPEPTDYSHAISSDPFKAEASDSEDDPAIDQANRNAKANTDIITPVTGHVSTSKEDAVKATLGRFAPGPRKAAVVQEADRSTKLHMDVNAFTRLLLTGQRDPTATIQEHAGQSTHAQASHPLSDSSSSADTASISQHSILEAAVHTHEETPRSSYELDRVEADQHRSRLEFTTAGKSKPPAPKSRRGKPLKDSWVESGPSTNFDNFINSLSVPDKHSVSAEAVRLESPSSDQVSVATMNATTFNAEHPRRTPPAPPSARRKHQQPPTMPLLTRSGSSHNSVLSDYDAPASPSAASSTTHKLPPPPPARRTTSSSDRRPSIDVSPAQEYAVLSNPPTRGDDHGHEGSILSKRTSQGPAPPLPPPRRARGSSQTSADVQKLYSPAMIRPSGPVNDIPDGTNKSHDYNDILADLAALQREVDAARANA